MIELPNGKIARTLPEQVEFLTDKVKELIVAFNQSGLKKIEIVEELPEVGDPAVLYLLAVEDPEEGNYYEEYLWIDNAWEMIGTTQVDLSNYVTLDTDQEISGAKTFTKDLCPTTNYGANLGKNNLRWGSIYIENYFNLNGFVDCNLKPRYTNNYDFGTNNNQWKDFYLSGKIYINGTTNFIYKDSSNRTVISTGGIDRFQVGSTCIFNTNAIIPYTTNNTSLGDSTHTWKDFHLKGIQTFYSSTDNGQDWAINNINGTLYFTRAGLGYTLALGGTTVSCKNLIPSNSDQSIGGASSVWKHGYFTDISDGINSIAVADIGKKLYKHTIQTDGGGGADLFILSTRSSAYVLPIDWLSLNTEAVKFLYNGCLVLRVYESGGVYYAQFINDSNAITNIALGASTIEDTVTAL